VGAAQPELGRRYHRVAVDTAQMATISIGWRAAWMDAQRRRRPITSPVLHTYSLAIARTS